MTTSEAAGIGTIAPSTPNSAARPTLWGRRAGLALVAGALMASGWSGLAWMQAKPAETPVVWQDSQLVATGELQQALYVPEAVAPQSNVKVSETFKSQSGETCRRFTEGLVNGIACQRLGDWRITELHQ